MDQNYLLVTYVSVLGKKTFSFGHCPNNGGGGDYPCPDFLASSLAIQNCDLANFLKLVKKKVAQSVRLSVGRGMQSLLGHVGNFLE